MEGRIAPGLVETGVSNTIEIMKYKNPGSVIGRNSFKNITHCVNKPSFKVKLDEDVKSGGMKPVKAEIQMRKASARDSYRCA